MNTRPSGLYEKAQPVTIQDPNSHRARFETDCELYQRRAEAQAAAVEWTPAATEPQLDRYRTELELDRQRRNRNARPAPLRVPGGAA